MENPQHYQHRGPSQRVSKILPGEVKPTSPKPLYIVGSERECEILRRRGNPATSTARPTSLEDAYVVLIPTSSNQAQMSETLTHLLGIASRIELLFLPGLLPGEDVRIWFGAQSAEDADELFRSAERVEITSIQGISAYLKQPISCTQSLLDAGAK